MVSFPSPLLLRVKRSARLSLWTILVLLLDIHVPAHLHTSRKDGMGGRGIGNADYGGGDEGADWNTRVAGTTDVGCWQRGIRLFGGFIE